MVERYFEDFSPGERFESRGVTLTESQIIDFALRYDPQPFHIDRLAAERSPFGGLIASGFQTLALAFRTTCDTGVFAACSLGSPGIEELRWSAPVRPGDTLYTTVEVLAARRSASRPGRGILRLAYETRNQHGEVVMSFRSTLLVRCRPGEGGTP